MCNTSVAGGSGRWFKTKYLAFRGKRKQLAPRPRAWRLANATVENVAQLHLKDLKIQDRYGVEFLTYWRGEARGLLPGPGPRQRHRQPRTSQNAWGRGSCYDRG